MRRAVLNIFMFHRVYPGASGSGLSPECFRRRLEYISHKYKVLDYKGLVQFLSGKDMGAGPFAVLTFDDGWLDNWLYATPILRALRCPAMLALSTGYLHDGPVRDVSTGAGDVIVDDVALQQATYEQDNRAFLSRAEVKAMVAAGVWNIQAHGHTHVRSFSELDADEGVYPDKNNWSLLHALDGRGPLPGLPVGHLVSDLAAPRKRLTDDWYTALRSGQRKGSYTGALEQIESEEQFSHRLKKDLQQCLNEILQLTGEHPDCMFWPWGHYTEQTLHIAQQLGLRYSFGVKKGSVVQSDAMDHILPRIGVSPKHFKFIRNSFTFRHPFFQRILSR